MPVIGIKASSRYMYVVHKLMTLKRFLISGSELEFFEIINVLVWM